MAFRGIGDAATQVIKDQNQLGMEAAQLSETARQFDARLNEQKASRAESAKQFEATQAANAAQNAEQTRQFDVTAGQRAQAAQESTRQYEQSRQDTIAQQGVQNARQAVQDERQYDLDMFKTGLYAQAQASDMETQDADTQMKRAQLKQYVSIADDEERRRKNRETLAKGTFGGLIISGTLNGGFVPQQALESASKDIGDKNTKFVAGYKDPETELWAFDIQGADGKITTLKMDPVQQYTAISEGLGEKEGQMFASLYKNNQTVSAAIERARVTAAEKAKTQRDPVKMITNFNAYADREEKLMNTDFPNRAQHEANARQARDAAARLTEGMLQGTDAGATKSSVGPYTMSESDMTKFGVPRGARVSMDKDGIITAFWSENGEVKKMRFREE